MGYYYKYKNQNHPLKTKKKTNEKMCRIIAYLDISKKE